MEKIEREPEKIGSPLGAYPYRLDPKRRITIPAIFRNRMGSPQILYVLPSLTGKNCLEIFQPEAFEMRLEKLNQAALTDQNAADFVTMLGTVSETVDVDVQGRIRISDTLLGHVGIDRDVIIVGAVNRIQIWAKENAPKLENAFTNVAAAARALNF